MPAVREEATESLLAYVTQSTEFRLFMGLAILNQSGQDALVKLEAYDPAGRRSSQRSFTVASDSRRVGLLNSEAFLGSFFEQTGGHLRLYSDRPISVIALVGDMSGRYLSVIESQRLQ